MKRGKEGKQNIITSQAIKPLYISRDIPTITHTCISRFFHYAYPEESQSVWFPMSIFKKILLVLFQIFGGFVLKYIRKIMVRNMMGRYEIWKQCSDPSPTVCGIESPSQFLLFWTESTAFKAYINLKISTFLLSKAFIRSSVVSAQGRGLELNDL